MRRLMIATLVLCACCAAAQTQPDPVLLAEIQKIKAIDNHTHVMKVVEPGQQDTEFDALPCDPLEPSGAPTMTRADNPAFLKAWKELYGYPYDDAAPQHLRVLTAAKEKVRRQQGENLKGSSSGSASATPGAAIWPRACRTTTAGTSGCSRACSSAGWPTSANRT